MPRLTRIANWGAIQGETGPATTQVLRRILGSGGDGLGGVLESAVMNVFRTTNVYGGETIPSREFIGLPPQLVIGFNAANIWNHGVQSNADYRFYRGDLVHFKLTSDGKVAIQNPDTNSAWLNVHNPGADETTIASFGPTIWLDANDPLGDGTSPLDITDATDIEALTGGHWADKGSNRHVTSSLSAGSQPRWYKTAGSSPAPPTLPNRKPCVSTIPGGVGSDNFTMLSLPSGYTVFVVLHTLAASTKAIGSHATGGAGNHASQLVVQSVEGGAGGWSDASYEIGTPPSTTRWQWTLGELNDGDAEWIMASWDSTGTHKVDGAASSLQQTDGDPAGTALILEEYFQRTINDGSIQRTATWYAELLVFDYVLNATQCGLVEEYLQSKWGVGTGGDGGGRTNPMIQGRNAIEAIAFEFDETGQLHIGGEAPVAPLTITDPSEQARIRYDDSNYVSLTVDANGNLTLDLVGTTPEFTFADNVNIAGDLTVTRTAAQQRLAYDGSNYVDFEVDSAGNLQITPTPAGSDIRFNYDASNYVKFEVSSSGDVTITPTGGDLTLVANFNLSGGITLTSTTDPQLRLKYDSDSYLDFGMVDTAAYMAATASSTYGDGTRLFCYSPIWLRQDFGGGPLTGPASTANDLVIATSDNKGGGDVGITLICGDTTSIGRLHFGDNDANSQGYLAYVHNNDTLYIATAASDRMTINSTAISMLVEGRLADNVGLFLGTGQDASILFNGTDLVINTQAVGSGNLNLDGGFLDIRTGGSGIILGDTIRLYMGSGLDAQLFHSGSALTMDNNVGATFFIQDSTIVMTLADDASYTQFNVSTRMSDNVKAFYGSSQDSSIYFNGSSMVINPKEQGSGGTLHTGAFWVFETADTAKLFLWSGDDSSSEILFGDSGDSDVGRIIYDHSDNTMNFYASAVAEMSVSTDLVTIGVGSGSSLRFTELAEPSTPAASQGLVFLDTADGILKIKHDDGTVVNLENGQVSTPFDVYIDKKERQAPYDLHGGWNELSIGDTLDSGSPINVTAGIGKIILLVIAGSDVTGSVTLSGTTVNRDTGDETASDSDVIAIDGVTTNNATTDANGAIVHGATNAYITSKWFKGAVTISTTDLTITDIDVVQVAFEQANDQTEFQLDTLDISAATTNASAWISAQLYSLEVTGNVCDVASQATIVLEASGVTAGKWYRLRRSNIGKTLDGSTDGFWLDVTLGPTNQDYWEDINAKVWTLSPLSGVLGGGGGGTTSPLTTKGDVYTYDTDNQRLAVGSDGLVLTADSGEGTGLVWASPQTRMVYSAGGQLSADGYLSSDGRQHSVNLGWIAPRAGSITGISCRTDGVIVSVTGTVEIEAMVNGAVVWAESGTIDGSGRVTIYDTQAAGTDAFAAGDQLSLHFDFIGGTDATLQIVGTLEVEWDSGVSGEDSPLTTKGDLYTFDTDDARLAIGTDGHVLTADSGEATGIKWAAAAGGGGWDPSVTASKTGAYTAADDDVVLCDTSGGAFAVTLPTPTANVRVVVKLVTAGNDLTVDTTSGNIDGAASIALSTQYQARTFIADGTNWHII